MAIASSVILLKMKEFPLLRPHGAQLFTASHETLSSTQNCDRVSANSAQNVLRRVDFTSNIALREKPDTDQICRGMYRKPHTEPDYQVSDCKGVAVELSCSSRFYPHFHLFTVQKCEVKDTNFNSKSSLTKNCACCLGICRLGGGGYLCGIWTPFPAQCGSFSFSAALCAALLCHSTLKLTNCSRFQRTTVPDLRISSGFCLSGQRAISALRMTSHSAQKHLPY